MEIYFASKEENNQRRQEEFLALSPGERLEAFLEMISKPSIFTFPADYKYHKGEENNFVITKDNGK